MKRRIPLTVSLLLAGTLGLAGCAHAAAGNTKGDPKNPANAGFGAVSPDPSASDVYGGASGGDQGNGSGNGSGNGNGGGNGGNGGHGTASPTPNSTGPHIISFTAKGAACPVDAKPNAPYSQPGEVTLSWKISGATGVTLFIDGGQYDTYSGTESTQKLYFACDNSKAQTVTHTYKIETTEAPKASKTASASAHSNPN
jgi:hypothetical protein